MPIGNTVKTRSGFTLPLLLLALALAGTALAGLGRLASIAVQRDKEAELLFRGGQIVQALGRYRAAQQPPQYPATLDELVADTRGDTVRHHLPRLYTDPFTGAADWVLVADEASGRIRGVHSRATLRPYRQTGLPAQAVGQASVADWVFAHTDPSPFRSTTP